MCSNMFTSREYISSIMPNYFTNTITAQVKMTYKLHALEIHYKRNTITNLCVVTYSYPLINKH